MSDDGLLNLDKPAGVSSAQALYRVRKITGVRKSGHAGTLDPGATGVLLIVLGRGTRLVERLMGLPKVYHARARLDVTSFTLDADGPLEPVAVQRRPQPAEIAQALQGFEGDIMQKPPAISAVKIGGRPAYDRARRGETVDPAPRPAKIYWTRLVHCDWPEIEFEMACGRGTYVRSLVRDLGASLGTGGCLTALRRTRVGPFVVDSGETFAALEARPTPSDAIIPLESVLELLRDTDSPPP